ncbi:unnamed protein product, partial [Pocillopora meandrina]
ILFLLLWSRFASGRPTRCSLSRNFLRYFPDAPEAQIECKACPKCPEGTGLTPLCGSKISNYTIIKCEPCRENATFSDTHSIESCRPCHDCGLRNIIQQCTPYQNRKCGNRCPERHFLDNNGFCQECYFCCSDVPESSRLKSFTNSNECIPLKGIQGAKDRDGSTETVEDVLEADDHEESTTSEPRKDQPKTDLIPADCKVSEMPQLRNHKNQILLHYVQRMLDPLEKQTKKNWRSIGQILNVSEEDLDLIDTDYGAGRSPTVSLIDTLSTFTIVPSMRSFVEALVACNRYNVAINICNWSWELRTAQ